MKLRVYDALIRVSGPGIEQPHLIVLSFGQIDGLMHDAAKAAQAECDRLQRESGFSFELFQIGHSGEFGDIQLVDFDIPF